MIASLFTQNIRQGILCPHKLARRRITIELSLVFLLLGAGSYVGWNIDANDTANCIGTTVGAGLLAFKRAVALVSVFAILGAVFQGKHVMVCLVKTLTSTNIQAGLIPENTSKIFP